ncbi:MAG: HipA N-terminal domain-containing protein [Usitatibacter sp.]
MNGRHAATWRVTGRGHELAYDEAWATRAEATPISLSMPIVPHALYRRALSSPPPRRFPKAFRQMWPIRFSRVFPARRSGWAADQTGA